MAAYDLKELAEGFKEEGLELTEAAAGRLFAKACDWFEKSAKESPTPYDDMALVVLPKLKEQVLIQVDKIDGKVG